MADDSDLGIRRRQQFELENSSKDDKLNLLINMVVSGKVHIETDTDDKLKIVYGDEKVRHLAHVDVSSAHTIQKGKNEDDMKKRVEVCLEMIEAIKAKRAPSGVAVSLSAQGDYREDIEFRNLQEVLGSGSLAGKVMVVEDIKTGSVHAMKTVMLSEFCTNEIRCWVDLDGSDSFPSLYLFRLDGRKVVFHMEKLESSVVMDDIIKENIWRLKEQRPDLVRPFSLFVFHDLLSTLKEMHDKNWTHNDLHSGNVMLTKDTMSVKVLDFGMAKPLRGELNFNKQGLKNDILSVIRLFCALYIGEDFSDNFQLQKSMKSGNVRETIEQAQQLSKEERRELFELVKLTYDVACYESQEGYGDPTFVMEKIKDSCNPKDKNKVMKMAAAVLFPEIWENDVVLHAKQGDDVADGFCDVPDAGIAAAVVPMAQVLPCIQDIDIEAVADTLPDDILDKLTLRH
ncbi:hypothetical protein C0Q70_07633 [Pomacea canaliculata]|uniref:Protein kinase domain-containing protein n=1 Tax=Pomacea canaliculata TaxID=400727 RepID=A0A2T7PFK3_POMCA|nr:hypothetical protein C0Q70_07633 [Pomacea canaliculata]